MPPLVRPIGVHAPLLGAHAGRCPVDFQVGCIDHDGLLLDVFDSQTGDNPREDAQVVPPFPTVVQRLVRPVGSGGIAPSRLMKLILLNRRR